MLIANFYFSLLLVLMMMEWSLMMSSCLNGRLRLRNLSCFTERYVYSSVLLLLLLLFLNVSVSFLETLSRPLASGDDGYRAFRVLTN